MKMKMLRLLGLVVAMAAFVGALACASEEPAEPAPTGPSAADIKDIVESAVGDQLSAADVQKIVDAAAGEQLSAADVQKIISESIAGQLTAADVQKIVDASTGKQLTAADVQKIVEASTGEQLTAADVQKIVDASAKGQLTTADVQKIISESISEAVEEAKKATAAATAAGKAAREAAMASVTWNGGFDWDSYGLPMPTTFTEAPTLAALVAQGKLPPVAERLPVASDVMVVPVVDRIGDYGGTWRRVFKGPGDGQNADRLMMDEILKFDLDAVTLLPNVVKAWEVSTDGLVYTFHLREGLKWSDGTPSTADDWTWYHENVIRNKDINPGREGQIGWSGYPLNGVEKVDDFTVRVTLAEAGAGFIDENGTFLTGGFHLHGREGDAFFGPSHYLKTVHPDFVADKAAYDKAVKDAGFDTWPAYFKEMSNATRNADVPTYAPWTVTSPNTKTLWEYERNPYYWAVDPVGNQLPYIDKISMVLIEDQEVIQLRAIAGEIDFQHRHIQMSKLPVFMENADKNNYNVAFWPPAHGAQAGIKFNLSYGFGDPLDYDPDPEIMKWNNDKDFRIAISHAINRSDIREALFQGVGTLTQVSYVKGHAFYPGDEWANKYTEYDPAKSNELLDGVGLTKKDSDGFRLRSDGKGTLSFVATWRDISDHGKFAEMIQSDLAEVGIKVILNLEDAKTYGSRRGRNIQEWHITHVGGARFPEVMTEWHTHGPAFRNWYTGGVDTYAIGNPGAEPTDPNILRIVDLTDQAKKLRYPDRAEVYKEVQRIMIDNMFHIGLVSANPASNGVIIKKNNFLNVPPKAPNDAYLQNPGVGRAIQFFFVDGKNDSE